MPLTQPGADQPDLPPITIDRANVAGMTPDRAHTAILSALTTGVDRARKAAGMVSAGYIAQLIGELNDTHLLLGAHAPYKLSPVAEETWCQVEGAGPSSPHWPCPTYRRHAATIAEGLP
jgi:hypothetical protein